MMNDNLCKVVDVFEENGMYNDIYLQWAEDHDGNYYAIIDSSSDENKFIEFVQNTLGVDSDFNVERELEIEIVYSDEYTTCSDCGHVIHTSPTSYHWQPEFYVGDGFIVCKECFKDNGYVDDYIEERINEPKNAINGLVDENDLKIRGFKRINSDSYESGWHRGQTDDPQTIYEDLRERFDEVIFFIDGVGQFDMHFSAWVRNEMDVVGR